MFSRNDNSVLARWWWTVDKWTLACLLAIVVIGVILNIAASPAVAERIGLPTFYFVQRHLILLPVGLGLMVSLSLLSPARINQLAFVGFLGALALTYLTLWVGFEAKGATRWIYLGGFSLQPSEMLKPLFAVVAAWLLTLKYKSPGFPGYTAAVVVYVLSIIPLILQPDLGMTVLLSGIFGVQFFIAGMPYLVVLGLVGVGIIGLIVAYFALSHVQQRVDAFMNPEGADTYQVSQSLKAFEQGGLFGTGPGEGTVKQAIPDVHADFVFAVAGEEFGFFMCLIIVVLFALVVLSGYARLSRDKDLFTILAVGGILAQFGFQAVINMASTLNLMPTKGMTLPFISYGGSSLLALGIGMGIVLGLTRKKAGGR